MTAIDKVDRIPLGSANARAIQAELLAANGRYAAMWAQQQSFAWFLKRFMALAR